MRTPPDLSGFFAALAAAYLTAFLVFVAVWIFVALMAGTAASKRGLSGFWWTIFGLFFGPIAIIIALLWPASYPVGVDRSSPYRPVPDDEVDCIPCQFCLAPIPARALKCRHCGETTRFAATAKALT